MLQRTQLIGPQIPPTVCVGEIVSHDFHPFSNIVAGVGPILRTFYPNPVGYVQF